MSDSASATRWKQAVPRDTQAEAHEEWWRRWAAEPGIERVKFVLDWSDTIARRRFEPVRREHLDAPPYEIAALWNERMYRGKMPDEALDKALAEIRRRGAEEARANDK